MERTQVYFRLLHDLLEAGSTRHGLEEAAAKYNIPMRQLTYDYVKLKRIKQLNQPGKQH
jgi:hypothetical protein